MIEHFQQDASEAFVRIVSEKFHTNRVLKARSGFGSGGSIAVRFRK